MSRSFKIIVTTFLVAFSLACVAVIFKYCDNPTPSPETVTNSVKEALEYAYFEGQKDAIEGNIKIAKNFDGCWEWIGSPWDSGDIPSFDISKDCNKNFLNN